MRYFPLFFLLLIGSFAQGQQRTGIPDTLYADIRCTYDFSFQENRSDTTKKWEQMELLIGEQGSVFQSSPQAFNDSMMATATSPQELFSKMKSKANVEVEYKIFKRASSGDIFYQKLYDYYTDHRDSLQWEIGSEQREIAGMPCQQATTSFRGRKYVAWFTFQIPISEGPYKFCGLPGLLVSIADTEGHYSFSLTSINHLSTPKMIINRKRGRGQHYTREEFLKIQHRRGLDPVGATAELVPKGTSVEIPEEAIRYNVERYLRQNNPIERDINFL